MGSLLGSLDATEANNPQSGRHALFADSGFGSDDICHYPGDRRDCSALVPRADRGGMIDNEGRTRPATDEVVEARGLTCNYGEFTALEEVDFAVQEGQVHALLGTNGAGKTTLLETIQGLRPPTSGVLEVLGLDPWHQRSLVAGRTGTMLQESGLVDEMTVTTQLQLWQALSLRSDRVARVLEVVGLSHRTDVAVAALSGGERRRLDFAMALWGDPELVILDEPTTGLDPQSRRQLWSVIRGLNQAGATVLLTTHYLEEAQILADRVTILDRGRIATDGTMSQVLSQLPATITFIAAPSPGDLDYLAGDLCGEIYIDDAPAVDTLGAAPLAGRHTLTVRTSRLQQDVGRVIDWSREHHLELTGLHCASASLEEVFFDLPSVSAQGQGVGR